MSGSMSGGVRQRIAHAFELCLSREPTRAELDRLERLYEAQIKMVCASQSGLASNSAASQRNAIDSDEATAGRALAQVLLNLDEFLTRE